MCWLFFVIFEPNARRMATFADKIDTDNHITIAVHNNVRRGMTVRIPVNFLDTGMDDMDALDHIGVRPDPGHIDLLVRGQVCEFFF